MIAKEWSPREKADDIGTTRRHSLRPVLTGGCYNLTESIVFIMSALKTFEMEAIRILTSHVLTEQTLAALAAIAQTDHYEYTGSGYFLTIQHPDIPIGRTVCDTPIVVGESQGVTSGFVVFLQNNELTLECHSWGWEDIPESYRDQDVQITTES